MTATKGRNHQHIENLLSVFESCSTSTSSLTLEDSQRLCFEQAKFRANASTALRERIELFERGCSSSSLKLNRSLSELDEIAFDDLVSRKSSLLESFSSLGSSLNTIDTTPSRLAEVLPRTSSKVSEALPRIPRRGRRPQYSRQSSVDLEEYELVNRIAHMRSKMEKRASTGRLLVSDEDKPMWELSDSYATQLNNSSNFSTRSPLFIPPRPCLERRHSTGSVCVHEEANEPMENFWQMYEEDKSQASSSNKPTEQKYARRRAVRFANHVTVWVFPDQHKDTSKLELPQTFKKKIYTRDCRVPRAPEAKKRSGEDRFHPNGGADAAPASPRRTSKNVVQAPSPPQRQRSSEGLSMMMVIPPTRKSSNSIQLPKIPIRVPSTSGRKKEINNNSVAGSLGTLETESFADASFSSAFGLEYGDDDDDSSVDASVESDESTIADLSVNSSDNDCTESGGSVLRAEDASNHDSEELRIEKALTWHRRLSMPSYEKMRQFVENTPGLDITMEDVDLLPWSKTSATYQRW